MDSDGDIDRCYNPDDKIKQRVKVPTACKFDAYTPSTDDENTIKGGTLKALELIESMESDLRNPSAANACQLNGLATLMGLPDYTHPHFAQLSSSILNRFEAIKPKLQNAANDLSSDPEIRYFVADAVTALRKRFSGVVCARADGSDLLYAESTLRYAYIPDKFIGGGHDIRDTIIHETHHTVGGEHDELGSFSNHRKAFDTMIAEYGKYAARQPNASAKRIFTTMTNNPHNLVWMMEALQCQ